MPVIALGTVLALAIGTVNTAEQAQRLPNGPAPKWVLASIDGDRVVLRFISVGVHKPDDVSNEERDAEVQIRIATRRFPKEEVTAMTADGRKLEGAELATKLEHEVVALLSSDGNKVDPFYLRPVKETTLVLVAKQDNLTSVSSVRQSRSRVGGVRATATRAPGFEGEVSKTTYYASWTRFKKNKKTGVVTKLSSGKDGPHDTRQEAQSRVDAYNASESDNGTYRFYYIARVTEKKTK